MAAPTHHIDFDEDGHIQVSLEYQRFIDRRTAFYRKMMVIRKLREGYAIVALDAALEVLNEQFARALAYSVLHERRSYILAH